MNGQVKQTKNKIKMGEIFTEQLTHIRTLNHWEDQFGQK